MSKKKDRISTSGNNNQLDNNPFGALEALSHELPKGERMVEPEQPKAANPKKGRLDVKRVIGGRGGKTVTLIEGQPLERMNEADLKALSLKLKKICGVGGTVKGKTLEVQGDKRENVAQVLELEGYRVVFAGG